MNINPIDEMLSIAARNDMESHKQDIEKRWNAYQNRAGKPLRVTPGDNDDNVCLGFPRLVVDICADALFGKEIDFVVTTNAQRDSDIDSDDQFQPDDVPDDWLEAAFEANGGQTLFTDIAVNGGVAGNAYVKMVAPNTVENDSEFPRLINIDPAMVWPILDPIDCKKVLQWQIDWNANDPNTNRQAKYRQIITPADDRKSWSIRDQVSYAGQSFYADISTEVWPYSWSPIFSTPNISNPCNFFGWPDLTEDVIEASNALNLTTSNVNRILRIYAHPTTFVTGMGAANFDITPGKFNILPSDDAEVKNLEMKSDLGSSLAFYDKLLEAFYKISRTPKAACGDYTGMNDVSGIAIKSLWLPLSQKVEMKRKTYGAMLKNIAQRMLELSHHGAGRVSIVWPNFMPEDLQSEVQAMQGLNQLGVSKRTILKKLGFSPDQELARSRAEQEAETAAAPPSAPSTSTRAVDQGAPTEAAGAD